VSLLAFVLLNLYQRYRSRLRWRHLLLYLAQYSFIRFLLEFLRVEVAYIRGRPSTVRRWRPPRIPGAIVIFLYRHRAGAVQRQRAAEAAPAESAAEQPASDSPQA
jgi:prolipoprotein diacylglyceryltransferase